MKILFINPPTQDNETWVREGRCQQYDIWGAPFMPLSLASIAGQIKSEKINVRVFDCAPKKIKLVESLEEIKNFSPDLIFLSVSTPTLESDLGWFALAVKRRFSQIKIVAIGIHVSVLPEKTLKDYKALDYIVMGEPEVSAKELVDCLESGGDPSVILGVALKKENGEIIVNKPRPYLENLDELKLPDWTGVDFNDYIMPIVGKPFALISVMRGCPFNCKFCASHIYNGKKIRKRSARKIVEEIKSYMKMGVCDFLFWAEFLTLDLNYLKELLDELEKENLGKKIRWVTNSRVDFVDLEVFKKMRKTGCWQIVFGIEFGSNRMLKIVDKGGQATIEQGRLAVETANKVGIVVDGHFVMGYPGETEETLKQTINFAASLPLTFAHFYAAAPFPGSELYQDAVENNWLIESDFGKVNQNTYNLMVEDLNPDLVHGYIGKAYKKFYLRPIIFWRILKIAKTPWQIWNIAMLGVKFMKQLIGKK